MQPFLQEAINTITPVQNCDLPKYLELLSDAEESSMAPENLTGGYEVPRSLPTTEKKTNSSETENPDLEQNETSKLQNTQSERIPSFNDRDVANQDPSQDMEKKLRQKRLSVTSLNLPEYRRASISNVEGKSRSLDNQKLRSDPVKVFVNGKGSLTFFSDFQKQNKKVQRRSVMDSETSLEERSNSSTSSNMSLAPPTRPSSSLINSQNSLPVKTSTAVSRDNLTSETNLGLPVLLKMQKTQSSLQKAKIPLVINNALLHLLQQTPGVEDNADIISYTNINTDAVRVNGS